MTTIAPSAPSLPVRLVVWTLHMALPLLGLWLLIAHPRLDVHWEHHASHFALTLTAALIGFLLGALMNREAVRREDARLFLVSLAFSASAGFFALHALSTPDIFVGRNRGFVIATPFGLLVAGAFAGASAWEFSPGAGAALLRQRHLLRGALALLLLAWLTITLLKLPPLDKAITPDEARGPLSAFMWAGSALYALAAFRYWQVYRRRPAVMLISLITAFVLLAETTVAATYGRNWELSWWEWHVLLITGYAFVAYSAVIQWTREGSATSLFGAISLNETLRDIQHSYGAALEEVVAAIEADDGAGNVEPAAARLGQRFELSERQIDVLVRSGHALARERDMIRRQGAIVEIGQEASVIRSEAELLDRVSSIAARTFGIDRVTVALVADGRVARDPAASLSLPLVVKGREAGVVEVTREGAALDDGDRALYAAFGSQLSIALENARLYQQIDSLFRSYLSPDVVTSLLADPTQAALGGTIEEITVLMADLRGFTPFSERSEPDEIVAMLNAYFAILVPIVLNEGGTITQFVGDAIMAIFNAPARQPDHALRAARAALRGQAAIVAVAAGRTDWPRFRMGINTGPALVGNVGSDDLRSFTAIGDTVNLAARLEGRAPVEGVVIGASTYSQLGDRAFVEPMGGLSLKGKADPVDAYRLLALHD